MFTYKEKSPQEVSALSQYDSREGGWCVYQLLVLMIDNSGEDLSVLVLTVSPGTWSSPWWLWLMVGVVALVLGTCCARALLRAAGVITDERSVKYRVSLL